MNKPVQIIATISKEDDILPLRLKHERPDHMLKTAKISQNKHDREEEGLMALLDKQKRFADEYLVNLNAAQAAIRAGGCSKKTAKNIRCENLAKPNIAAAMSYATH